MRLATPSVRRFCQEQNLEHQVEVFFDDKRYDLDDLQDKLSKETLSVGFR